MHRLRTWFTSLLLGALLLSTHAPASALAADITISNSNPPYVCNQGGLEDAIDASGNGTVRFACPPSTTIAFGSTKSIAVNVTIDGSNGGSPIILSGGGNNRIFTVQANKTVTLTNLTLQQGFDNSALAGGAVYGVDITTRLVLLNTNFRNNSAPYGGAVFSQGPILVTGGTFQNNTASINEGAIGTNNTLAVTGTTFISNTAATSGGAIGAAGSTRIVNSGFYSNTATNSSGGAIFTTAGVPLFVRNSTFTTNHAQYGGGLEANGPATIEASRFENNNGQSVGGAIRATAALTVTGSLLRKNTSNNAAGIQAIGPAIIQDSQLIQNQANFSAGGILFYTTAYVLNSDFEQNSGESAGALYASGPIYIFGSSFVGNSVPGSGAGAVTLHGTGPAGWLARIYDSTFSGNSSAGSSLSAGGVVADGSSYPVILSIQQVTFYNNTALVGGAGNLYTSPNTTTTVLSSIFTGGQPVNCILLGTKDPLSSGNIDSGSSCVGPGNLLNTDPQLSPLSHTGGLTPAHLPRITSPAVNAVSCVYPTDQHGTPRPQPAGGLCDIGAIELIFTHIPLALRNASTGW